MVIRQIGSTLSEEPKPMDNSGRDRHKPGNAAGLSYPKPPKLQLEWPAGDKEASLACPDQTVRCQYQIRIDS